MADLDTRSKRASSAGLMLTWLLAPVFPDATLAQGDRQHSAWSYSGILASGAAGAGAYTQIHHHHHANG